MNKCSTLYFVCKDCVSTTSDGKALSIQHLKSDELGVPSNTFTDDKSISKKASSSADKLITTLTDFLDQKVNQMETNMIKIIDARMANSKSNEVIKFPDEITNSGGQMT